MLYVVTIAVIGLAAWLIWQAAKGSGSTDTDELYRICRGDEEKVERLIGAEQKRNPKLNRAQAVKAAVYSYKRDNR